MGVSPEFLVNGMVSLVIIHAERFTEVKSVGSEVKTVGLLFFVFVFKLF